MPGATLTSEELIALRTAVLEARLGPRSLSALPGGFTIKRKGNGQDVADNRAYVEGDDLRHLDRGATARTGVLHIRTFQEERDQVVLLVADFRPSMLWGMERAFRSVVAAEALAIIGWQAIEAGARVGLLAVTGTHSTYVPARGRVRGMLDVIGGMVRAHEQALGHGLEEPNLDELLDGIKRVVPSGAEIVIASGLDACGDGFDDLLGDLARRRDVRLVMVEDRAAQRLPPGVYPLETPDGRRISVQVDGARNLPEAAPDTYPSLHIDASMPMRELAQALNH